MRNILIAIAIAGMILIPKVAGADVAVTIGSEAGVRPGQIININVDASDTTGLGLTSCDLRLIYPTASLKLIQVYTGDLTSGWEDEAAGLVPPAEPVDVDLDTLMDEYEIFIHGHTDFGQEAFTADQLAVGRWFYPMFKNDSGTVTIAPYGKSDLSGAGSIVRLKFVVMTDAAVGTAILDLTQADFNEGAEVSTLTDGAVEIVAGGTVGDVNSDTFVNIADVMAAVNYFLDSIYEETADLNGDLLINIADVMAIVLIVLHGVPA